MFKRDTRLDHQQNPCLALKEPLGFTEPRLETTGVYINTHCVILKTECVCFVAQRQKQMLHLEKELTDAAVEDNKKLRLRLVQILFVIIKLIGIASCTDLVYQILYNSWIILGAHSS